jgi:hypothetical protein
MLAAATLCAAQDLRYPPLPLSERAGYEVNSWLTLKPYLRTGAFYTNNVFQEPNADRVGDTVYPITPGLDARVSDGDQRWLEVGYAPTFLVYHHRGGLDTVEHRLRYVGQAAAGDFVAKSSGYATWAVYNTDPQFNGRVRNFQGSTNLDVSWALDEVWGAKGTAFASEARNFPDQLEPTNTQEWGGAALVTASPRLDEPLELLAGGTFREVHYFDREATQPDLSMAGPAVGAKLSLRDVFRLEALGGVEFPWVKKHNGLDRSVDPDPTGILNATAWITPREGTELLLTFRHRLDASASAPWQRSTTVSASFTQELPADLRGQLVATFSLRQPRGESDLRQQSYQAVLLWSPWEHLELGVQAGYTRQSVKDGGYEAFSFGGGLTVKL